MHAQPNAGRRARVRIAAAAACSVLVALGGVLLAGPAQAATVDDACATTTGAPTGGVVDLRSATGGLVPGLLDCAVGADGGTAPTDPPSAPAEAPRQLPVDQASPGVQPASAAPTDPASAPTEDASVAALQVSRSSNTVYPVKDGYLDAVRFSVRALTAAGTAVPIVGDAVLTRGGATVRTWHLDGLRSVITWDGRVHGAVRAGLYTLHVTAATADGSTRTATTTIRVKRQHLVRRVMTIRTDVGAQATSADLPKQLLGAYRYGAVRVATRTTAVVRGPAKLIFTGSGGHRTIRLRDGVHTTRAIVLPPGFEHTSIRHAWAKGAARLTSLQAVWTYYTLV